MATFHHRRVLRLSKPQLAQCITFCEHDADGLALLTVQLREGEDLQHGRRTEVLVRGVAARDPASRCTAGHDAAHTVVLGFAAQPTQAMAHLLAAWHHTGVAGCAVLPQGDATLGGARGLLFTPCRGVQWLDELSICQPGLPRTSTCTAAWQPSQTASIPRAPLWQRLQGTRVAICGGSVGAALAGALAQTTTAVVSLWPVLDEAALFAFDPDVVFGCDPTPRHRAALARWCADHHRALVEVLPAEGDALALQVCTWVPGHADPAYVGRGARNGELFDEAEVGGAISAGDAWQTAHEPLWPELLRTAARCAMAALLDLLDGRVAATQMICIAGPGSERDDAGRAPLGPGLLFASTGLKRA